MSRRYALKRLTASDLTFFQWHYENENAGNQKAINLNADVFAEQLFPRLVDGTYKVGLTLVGPGDGAPLTMTRKILKNPAYKNWRLDGETVDKEQARFSVLRPGDYALMAFEGESEPEDIRIMFFARAVPADGAMHAALGRFVPEAGRQSMGMVGADDLRQVADEIGLPPDHALRALVIDPDLVEAAIGGAEAVERLIGIGRQARIDKATLLKARAQGDAIGELGESLIDIHLERCRQAGRLRSYRWVSRDNAIAPMDFEATDAGGTEESIEVKCTSGEFDRSFHVSLAELRFAASSQRLYRIYRVSEATDQGARLAISQDFRPLATSILEAFRQLPVGVLPDSVSIRPALLTFEGTIRLDPGE